MFLSTSKSSQVCVVNFTYTAILLEKNLINKPLTLGAHAFSCNFVRLLV